MITIYGPKAEKSELKTIELIKPEKAGDRWSGIQHYDLVSKMEKEIKNRGWKILDSKFALNNNDRDLCGAFSLDVGKRSFPGGSYAMGFIHSNDLKKSLRIMVGGEVTICHNGLVTGEIVMNKRHTKNLDIDFSISEGMDIYFKKLSKVRSIVNSLRKQEVSEESLNGYLVACGEKGILPWSRVGKVLSEYREPSYDYPWRRGTKWDLLNAFTEIVKVQPVHTQMDRINQFRCLLAG